MTASSRRTGGHAGWYRTEATLLWVMASAAAACATDPYALPRSDDAGTASALLDCAGPAALQATTVRSFVAHLTHSKWRYAPLTIDAMNAVMAATTALDAGDPGAAADAARLGGYQLAPLVAAGACYWTLQPVQDGSAQQATLIYAPSWRRNLVIEAPHVPDDHHTDIEAADLFVRLGAKAVMIAGSQRCSVTTPSGCRDSLECNQTGVAVESDPAHSTDNALHAMHLAFRSTPAVVLQLHTNLRPEINGDALVSNGTHFVIPGTVADAFYAALQAPDIDVRSCNDPQRPQSGRFCGATNAQGLASNGAADTCLGHASSAGGAAEHRFIHLEQSSWRTCWATNTDPLCVGNVDTWIERIATALSSALPVDR